MRPMIRMFVLAAAFPSATAAFAIDRATVNVSFSFKTTERYFQRAHTRSESDLIYHTLKLSSTGGATAAYDAVR
jgi:hypothetical protein